MPSNSVTAGLLGHQLSLSVCLEKSKKPLTIQKINKCQHMVDVSTLGIKALKELITSAGLSTADCIDKEDLRARALEAQAKLALAPASAGQPSAPDGVSSSSREIAGYRCLVKGPPELLNGSADASPADLVVIGLHGLGAAAEQLAELKPMLSSFSQELGSLRVMEVYPQAPQTPLGAAWWMFNVMGYMQAVSTQDQTLMGKLIREKPEGIDACRNAMTQLVLEARRLAGGSGGPVAAKKVLLAGFSLGAITSLDLALQQAEGEGVGGVLFMNGAPICIEEWTARLKVHKGLRVQMSGGLADTILPHQSGGWVHQLLEANGAQVKYKLHPGGHELGGPDVLKEAADFVVETAARARV
jgi:phospholipase/carboxylesterase